MNKYISYIFIISASMALAQAPGHLGKRFVIAYGAHFCPALINSNAHNKSMVFFKNHGSSTKSRIAFNYTHEIYLEYALNTRLMLGFSGKFYKTNYDNYEAAYPDNYGSYVSRDVLGYYKINGQSICLYGKLYNKRYVAPWGRYKIIGPVLNLYQTTYDRAVMFQEDNSFFYKPFNNYGPLNQSFVEFNIVFGWGRTRIIANRITLDYGINMQVLMIPELWDYFKKRTARETFDNSMYIKNTALDRIRFLNRINAFVKIGFLIF